MYTKNCTISTNNRPQKQYIGEISYEKLFNDYKIKDIVGNQTMWFKRFNRLTAVSRRVKPLCPAKSWR